MYITDLTCDIYYEAIILFVYSNVSQYILLISTPVYILWEFVSTVTIYTRHIQFFVFENHNRLNNLHL